MHLLRHGGRDVSTRRPVYPYDRSGLTEEDVRRIARAETRALLAHPGVRNAYAPGSIPLRTVDLVPVVTALPTRPIDGDEVYFLADAAAGVVWHLRYREGNDIAYPWEFVGGPPLRETSTGTYSSASTSYADIGHTALTFPLAGDYDVEWATHTGGSVATSLVYTALKFGAAAASDNDAMISQPPGVNYVAAGPSFRIKRVTGIAAETELTLSGKVNAGTGQWGEGLANAYRAMTAIHPVRVRRA